MDHRTPGPGTLAVIWCRSVRGISLVECLVVVCLVSILSVVAVPALRTVTDGVQQREVVGSLHEALLLARSEAIKTNARVVICRSANGTTCAGAGGWEQGWIIFRDADNSAQREPGEVVLDTRGPMSSGWRVLPNQPFASYVSFRPDGRAAYRSGAFQAGAFTVCREGSGRVQARQLVLSSSGRPRVERLTLTACTATAAA